LTTGFHFLAGATTFMHVIASKPTVGFLSKGWGLFPGTKRSGRETDIPSSTATTKNDCSYTLSDEAYNDHLFTSVTFFTIYISTVQLYVNVKEEMLAPRHCSALYH